MKWFVVIQVYTQFIVNMLINLCIDIVGNMCSCTKC